MKAKIDLITKNETWEVVDRPLGIKSVTAKWIYKIKCGPTGMINKFKARIIAQGFQQQKGIDFLNIFAPIVRWSTIRIIFVLATKNRWLVHEMDVTMTFLNGILQQNVYKEIPNGFCEANDNTKVCKVNRVLYGL